MLMIGLFDNSTEKEQEALWISADYFEWFFIQFLQDMHSYTPKYTIGDDYYDSACNTMGKEKRQKTKKT